MESTPVAEGYAVLHLWLVVVRTSCTGRCCSIHNLGTAQLSAALSAVSDMGCRLALVQTSNRKPMAVFAAVVERCNPHTA